MADSLEARTTLAPPVFVRAANFDFDLVRAQGKGTSVMSGQLAVFDEWAEIDSPIEGHFMERMAQGAFTKTIQENGRRLKVLFQHGMDYAIGKKPLGRILNLAETERGVRYDVELLDAPYVNDLIPGLEAGLYGTSFSARDIKHDERRRGVERSDYNPKRLPEVTRLELELKEFGPVTFPQYEGAAVRMRSMTDDFMLPGLRDLVAFLKAQDLERAAALTTEEPEPEPTQPPDEETPDEGKESTSEPAVSRSTQEATDNDQEVRPAWLLE